MLMVFKVFVEVVVLLKGMVMTVVVVVVVTVGVVI